MLITDAIQVFRQGQALANAGTWANTAAVTVTLTGFLSGCVHVATGLGYDLSFITDGQIQAIAGGVAAAVCVVSGVLHLVANPAAGVRAPADGGDTGGTGPSGG